MLRETSERKVTAMNGIRTTARTVELLALVTAPFVLIALVFIVVFSDHTQKATATGTATAAITPPPST